MNYLRQLDILDPKLLNFPITLIGYGGINSFVGPLMAMMGVGEMTLQDKDSVEGHNVPNQLFRKNAIDEPKVEAGMKLINDISDCAVTANMSDYTDAELDGIIIAGVDSMQPSRENIWNGVKWNANVPLYIDGRIGAEQIEVFTVRPCQIQDVEFYDKWMFPNDESAPLACTRRSVAYVGFMIAALIASNLKKWIKNESYFGRISYNLFNNIQIVQHEVKP